MGGVRESAEGGGLFTTKPPGIVEDPSPTPDRDTGMEAWCIPNEVLFIGRDEAPELLVAFLVSVGREGKAISALISPIGTGALPSSGRTGGSENVGT
jgi:hypothetical protein